ncbi:MAG: peptide deformylase, partial [Polyangiales bacterium]
SLPPLVHAGAPVLRAPARAVRDDELAGSDLRSLVETMIAVMRDAPGVGLAAPQIGVDLQVIVLEDDPRYTARLSAEHLAERERVPFEARAIVNPQLTLIGEEQATFFEGCLSVPGYTALVSRTREVEVTGVDVEGAPVRWRVRGWPARILQHEVDHLRGTLYVDRMLTRTFCTAEQLGQHWGRMPIAEVRRVLGV